MKRVIVGLLTLLGSTFTQAGGLDLSLSKETANLAVLLSPGLRYIPNSGGGSDISIGAFTNEAGDSLAFGMLMVRGVRQSDTAQYKLGAGVKVIAGDLDIDESVGALALGFQTSVLLASSAYNPVDFVVSAFYAPSISSFNDAETFTEYSARFQVEVIPQARAFIGYRRMQFDTNDFKDLTMDRSVHVGLSLNF